MTGSLAKEEKTAEAGKTSNQSENYDVESVIRVASCAWNAIHCLLASYEYDLYSSWLESHFTSLKDCINKMEKDNSFTKDSAIIKFCRSIAENNKLYKELKI
ncbi:hypothetical protein [Wolbachia endosymbiont of Drosophila pseudotakahashii]|uniref:hypothetical protein n=1 Tax=Wolbachia endosymbiont of Drosophila pseudotakahashii TaxID=375919 RepID=UPI0022308854|nr:hypothetical protein [Wolbachia endosymbiont of Drosophila pseudotakahashii]MCX3065636.1 hypothetical protein [Wolbachia endosymbiont of Drosophila pseudotakahashii]UZE38153.1 hypothetical protein ONI09_04470 [Wolbachia endosymbiont of Drosophila pseudotakahashii]